MILRRCSNVFQNDRKVGATLRELYYWTLICIRKVNPSDEDEFVLAYFASYAIGFLMFANLLTVFDMFSYFVKFELSKLSSNTLVIISLILGVLIFVFNHFYLVTNRKIIVAEQEQYSFARRRKGKGVFVLYLILSIASWWYSSSLIAPHQ